MLYAGSCIDFIIDLQMYLFMIRTDACVLSMCFENASDVRFINMNPLPFKFLTECQDNTAYILNFVCLSEDGGGNGEAKSKSKSKAKARRGVCYDSNIACALPGAEVVSIGCFYTKFKCNLFHRDIGRMDEWVPSLRYSSRRFVYSRLTCALFTFH